MIATQAVVLKVLTMKFFDGVSDLTFICGIKLVHHHGGNLWEIKGGKPPNLHTKQRIN